MKFKENQKTALAKVLSDLVQCDGIVNQGEIDFLQQVYAAFNITSSSRKKATSLTLADAVRNLKSLGHKEKIAILRVFQQLSLSDNAMDTNESLLITALLLSIDIDLPETQGIKAHFVSIPNLNFDTRNAVLYVEAQYDANINASILKDHEAICQLLRTSQREFFYLPKVIQELQDKRKTFRNMLSYIEPTLDEEQLDLIDRDLSLLVSVDLSKEIFLNYLNTSGINIDRPSFFFKIGNLRAGHYQDFLILEINDDPLLTLQRIITLNDNIGDIHPQGLSQKEEQFLQKLKLSSRNAQKDKLSYTGFHKIIIDILLKRNDLQENSRLFITNRGNIYLTDRNNTEVKMPALSKSLYILFLLHEEGISLNYLNDYKTELYRIYRQISTYADDELLMQAIDNLTDFVGSTMNATLSRIKKAFTSILGDNASYYLIQGEKGERKTIHLDRNLVVYENREAFE